MECFDYTAQCAGGAAISGTLEMTDGEAAMKQLDTMTWVIPIALSCATRPGHRTWTW